MKSTRRKTLRDINTRSNLATEAAHPQRKFLRAASLELRRSLCNIVKKAAIDRAAEMDRQLVEIENEQVRVLCASESPSPRTRLAADAAGLPQQTAAARAGGFTMKY